MGVKWLEVLKEVAPPLTRGIVLQLPNRPGTLSSCGAAREAGQAVSRAPSNLRRYQSIRCRTPALKPIITLCRVLEAKLL